MNFSALKDLSKNAAPLQDLVKDKDVTKLAKPTQEYLKDQDHAKFAGKVGEFLADSSSSTPSDPPKTNQ